MLVFITLGSLYYASITADHSRQLHAIHRTEKRVSIDDVQQGKLTCYHYLSFPGIDSKGFYCLIYMGTERTHNVVRGRMLLQAVRLNALKKRNILHIGTNIKYQVDRLLKRGK